jgi:hypothetical protein
LWAGVIDQRYATGWEWPEGHDLSGPVDAALTETNGLLAEIFRLFCIQENGITVQAVYLSFLARHVIPTKAVFDSWLKLVLERLTGHYPRLEGEEIGSPPPRESLDPGFDFRPDMDQQLLGRFLRGLDYTQNPYLRSPEQMLRLGFEGTPYTI